MKLNYKKTGISFKNNDTIAFFITENNLKEINKILPKELNFIVEKIDLQFFKAKSSESIFIPLNNDPNIILLGLGKDKEITDDVIRNASAKISSVCRDKNIDNPFVVLPENLELKSNILQLAAEGVYLSNYNFNKYKSKDDKNKNSNYLLKKVTFLTDQNNASKLLKDLEILLENTLLCRDQVNETSDNSNPLTIAAEAKKLQKLTNVTCKIYGKKDLEKMNMGLLLAVNRGSKNPAQLVVLKYNGNPDSKKYFAVIGKGITFDSGGLNLKPSGSIEDMRTDMAGAATALYTFKSIAELKLKKNIYAVIPLTENLIGNESYRPGDVFQAYNGKTVEIGNTDAEGRLILADALAFTEDKLKPEYIVDLATLTGACLVALGEIAAALLSTDDGLKALIQESSNETGEKVWELPLFMEYNDSLKSDIADLRNIGSDRYAGTIVAATFLKNFVKKTKWAHIDIAGTGSSSKPRGYVPKNGTGYGVRLMVETIKKWKM